MIDVKEKVLHDINTIMWNSYMLKNQPFGRPEGLKIMKALTEWAEDETRVHRFTMDDKTAELVKKDLMERQRINDHEIDLIIEALGYGVMFSRSESQTAEFALLKIKLESARMRKNKPGDSVN